MLWCIYLGGELRAVLVSLMAANQIPRGRNSGLPESALQDPCKKTTLIFTPGTEPYRKKVAFPLGKGVVHFHVGGSVVFVIVATWTRNTPCLTEATTGHVKSRVRRANPIYDGGSTLGPFLISQGCCVIIYFCVVPFLEQNLDYVSFGRLHCGYSDLFAFASVLDLQESHFLVVPSRHLEVFGF